VSGGPVSWGFKVRCARCGDWDGETWELPDLRVDTPAAAGPQCPTHGRLDVTKLPRGETGRSAKRRAAKDGASWSPAGGVLWVRGRPRRAV
jgi:hypothetical protein